MASFELKRLDLREFAKTVCCHQAIAADGAFSLGMLAQFEPVLRSHGPHAYRELFWETESSDRACIWAPRLRDARDRDRVFLR